MNQTLPHSVPDIVRHMANVIARAEHEVFLSTNYWLAGEPSFMISNALRELSKRAGERGKKAVVKIIYDRGNIKQVRHTLPLFLFCGTGVSLGEDI
jgi:hypothetical protein